MQSIRLKRSISTIIALGGFVILCFILFFTYNLFAQASDAASKLDTEVVSLRQKVTILKNNKNLVSEQIDGYNQLLAQLIPDTEDFFTITYAIEKISQQSGFIVTGYTINISETSREKYSLIVEGQGNPNALLAFLKDYQFSGGRLVTNEKVEFSTEDTEKIKLSLNFYSKPINKTVTSTTQITPIDLQLMEKVKAKTMVVFKAPDTGASEDYKTKTNPF